MNDSVFEHELEVFRRESEEAAQYFYAHMAIHAIAAERSKVLAFLNYTPLFWVTCTAALQAASIIALGRLFDNDSPHNLGVLIRMARNNPAIFSKEALARRKSRSALSAAQISEFIRTAYVPIPQDFRRLKRLVGEKRQIYERNYRQVRHEWFAHKVVADPEAAAQLFARTNTGELQRLFAFLASLHNALWELFFNGRKPVLRSARYSVRRMRILPASSRESVRERIVHEAEEVLIAASKAKPTKYIRLLRNRKKAKKQKERRAMSAFRKAIESQIRSSTPSIT